MECTALKMWAHQYMRLKWVAMKMPGPQVGHALRRRCTLPESSTCIGEGQNHCEHRAAIARLDQSRHC